MIITFLFFLLHQVSPPCTYLQTTIFFEIGSEKFSCSGKVLKDPGFTTIMPWLALGDEEEIPTLRRDEKLSVAEVESFAFSFYIIK